MSAPEKKDVSGGRETRSFSLQIKSTGEDGTIEGYGSVFGVRDNYDDVILKGAFTQSLKEHKAAGTMPAMLWQHDADEPIGVWTDMVEDSNGLLIKGKLELNTTKGKEAHALLKIGALNGLSIGFVSKSWDYATVDGADVRRLKEIDLWEVSIVTFPANQKARVTNVKSSDDMATPKDAERILRDAGFSKSDSTAFVSRVMRMGEVRRDSVDSTAVAMKAANKLLNSLTSTKGKS
ncbi:HK97 family phage prohead protease [Undibacterium sp. BYS107W]|uniref:HK97 family phage prohead protease n=2 Tax=Undibacterium baiyunense TaxID=2828731 RepID=A0A941DID0_9BURK|nr:HK97 family phage prohead protease [Undibacterium baiyunense]